MFVGPLGVCGCDASLMAFPIEDAAMRIRMTVQTGWRENHDPFFGSARTRSFSAAITRFCPEFCGPFVKLIA